MNSIRPTNSGMPPVSVPSTNTEKPYSDAEFKLSIPEYKGINLHKVLGVDEEAENKIQEIYHAYSRLSDAARRDMTNTTFDMRNAYTNVQIDLYNSDPKLMEKDWDFSVDSEGKLLIIEGKDELSKSEVMKITDIMEEHGIDNLMKNLSKSIVDRGVGERGPQKLTLEKGIGSYDITMENMSEIIKGRELMNDTQMRPLYKGGTVEKADAIKAYNENKATPYEAVLKQLVARAEQDYDYDPSVYYDIKTGERLTEPFQPRSGK